MTFSATITSKGQITIPRAARAVLNSSTVELEIQGETVKGLELFATTSLDPVDCILAGRSAIGDITVMTFDKSLKKTAPRR